MIYFLKRMRKWFIFLGDHTLGDYLFRDHISICSFLRNHCHLLLLHWSRKLVVLNISRCLRSQGPCPWFLKWLINFAALEVNFEAPRNEVSVAVWAFLKLRAVKFYVSSTIL